MSEHSVVPIYARSFIDKKYHSVGSAVLVLYKGVKLFISAAHVFEACKGMEGYIFIEDTFYQLIRVPVFLSNGDGYENRRDDPLDLAAMILSKDLATAVKNLVPVTFDEYIEGSKEAAFFYQAIGFPSSKNSRYVNKTVRRPGKFRAEGIIYTVHDIGSEVFPSERYYREYHRAVCLTKTGVEKKTGRSIDLPKLKGLSGGLLQKCFAFDDSEDDFQKYYPEGVIIEQCKEHGAMIAVNFSTVFNWLDYHLSGMKSDFESMMTDR